MLHMLLRSNKGSVRRPSVRPDTPRVPKMLANLSYKEEPRKANFMAAQCVRLALAFLHVALLIVNLEPFRKPPSMFLLPQFGHRPTFPGSTG